MSADTYKPKPFKPSAAHAKKVAAELARLYPDARCALDHRNLFELIVATILSAQCTDKRVNMVTPRLFERYPDAAALAAAEPAELEDIIHSTGFYKAKAKNLLAMARGLVEKHDGKVPETMEALTKLAGVGRKTANVVLGVGLGKALGIVVDTHVTRLSQRLGLTTKTAAVPIERDLEKVIPKPDWVLISLRMIDHGRAVCKAGRPLCVRCDLAEICPKIGVEQKPAKPLKTNARKSAKPSAESVKNTFADVVKPLKTGKTVAKSSRIGTMNKSKATPARAGRTRGKLTS